MYSKWIDAGNLRSLICRVSLLFSALLLLASNSCVPGKSVSRRELESGPVVPFTVKIPQGHDIFLRGRLRAELPRYRVKGILQVYCSAEGSIRLDFHYSGLMGAHEEEYTILISEGKIYMFDRMRETLYREREVLEIFSDALDMDVYVDDIPRVLLFRGLDSEIIYTDTIQGRGGRWKIEGEFRGRKLAITGSRYIESIEQCDSRKCYVSKYIRYRGVEELIYPFYIILARKPGTEKVTFEVSDGDIVKHDKRRFTLDGIIFSYNATL